MNACVEMIEIVARGLQFPESPLWSARNGCVYFVEWAGDRVGAWRAGRVEIAFETRAGDGPSGLAQAADGGFWLCLYSSRRLARCGPTGEVLQVWDNCAGRPFLGPNDLTVDAGGGVYFTDSGNFEDDWRSGRPAGALYYLSPSGELRQVDGGLCYPNGLALAPDGRCLVVNEHRQNRLLQYAVDPDGGLSARQVFFELDADCLLDETSAYELGPDGMCGDADGNFWVAHYGGGKIVGIDPEGKLRGTICLPEGRKPTNVTYCAAEQALYVTESERGLLYRIGLRCVTPRG